MHVVVRRYGNAAGLMDAMTARERARSLTSSVECLSFVAYYAARGRR